MDYSNHGSLSLTNALLLWTRGRASNPVGPAPQNQSIATRWDITVRVSAQRLCLCIYTCVFVFVCVCLYLCFYILIFVFLYFYMCICVFVHLYLHTSPVESTITKVFFSTDWHRSAIYISVCFRMCSQIFLATATCGRDFHPVRAL